MKLSMSQEGGKQNNNDEGVLGFNCGRLATKKEKKSSAIHTREWR